ncbi:uncharacterized protein ACJ7VT_018386 [Polymixia lowei]
MNSLVGYGLSSDSDSGGDDVNNHSVSSGREASDGVPAVNKTRNFLVESGSASSESGSEPEPEEEHTAPSPPPYPLAAATPPAQCQPLPPLSSLTPNKLPPPPLESLTGSSIFANPFKVQADQKLNALQKHVPLTMHAKPSQIGGKRMCVAYRKDGRCRFGIKCKFAHDSDLQTSVIPSDFGPPVGSETPESDQAESKAGGSGSGGPQSFAQEREQEESEGEQRRKRRVGLSNTLVPPKRALKQYSMQRNRERHNMH